MGVVKVMNPPDNVSKQVWHKFPVLAPSRSENADPRRYPQPNKDFQ